MAIKYQEVIVIRGGPIDHAIGIAEYSDTKTNEKFNVYVTGNFDAIHEYAEQVNILSMEMAPTDHHDDHVGEPRMTILQEQHDSKDKELEPLNMLLPNRDEVESMPDDDQWLNLNAKVTDSHKHEEDKLGWEHKLDWEHDRLIEIDVPEASLEPDKLYHLSYTIDPTVATGKCDVYGLRKKRAKFASASIDTRGGNPDLYLYRNRSMFKKSESGQGIDEEVSGRSRYPAFWRVHVYGRSTASYTINTRWVIKGNEERGHRH